jgi:hypothetical protein
MGLNAYVPGCNCYKEDKEFCEYEHEVESVSERISNWEAARQLPPNKFGGFFREEQEQLGD